MGSATAQGMPVIDAAHILESIHNGYQMYQSVMNSIKQLEYAYVSTQAQLKQLQQLDMNKIRSFTDAVSYVDKHIDFVRRTENRFKAITVTVGGKQVPISQFYRLPGEAAEMIVHDLTADMSDWEKARAWSHYGLNPANYMYTVAWKGRLNEAAKQMTVIGDVIDENNRIASQEMDAIMAEAEKSESSLAVLQSLTALMQILIGQQMEANRLNALNVRYQADRDIAADMPVDQRSRFSKDWIE
jgi:conjugal transfer/entry exclusion protein